MNTLRRATGLAAALSVLGVTPGLDFYHAAAQTIRAPGRNSGPVPTAVSFSIRPGGSSSLAVGSPSLGSLSGSLKSFSAPKLVPSALPGSECPGSGRLVGDEAPAPSGTPRGDEGRGRAGDSGDRRETPAPQDRPERWDREWRKGGDALIDPVSAAPELAVEKIADMPAGAVRANGHAIQDWLTGRKPAVPGSDAVSVRGNEKNERTNGTGLSSRKVPDPDGSGSGDDRGQGSPDNEPVDDLGNPPRRQSPGPDDTTDDGDRGSSGGGGPVLFGASVLAWTGLAASLGVAGLLAVHFLMIVPSLILHEMAHAKAADLLGDPTPRLDGRLSWRPKDLAGHLDFTGTLLLPVALILASAGIGAWARPVEPEPANFKRPVRDTALVALAGPATHVLLAIAGAGVFWGLAAWGVGGAVLAAAAFFVFVNAALALLNLMPVFPFDGHHILRALLPARAASALDSFYENHPILRWIPTVLVLALLGGVVLSAAGAAAGALIGPASVTSLLGGLGG